MNKNDKTNENNWSNQLLMDIPINSTFMRYKILNFMKKWFLNHIIQTDFQYKGTVKKILDYEKE